MPSCYISAERLACFILWFLLNNFRHCEVICNTSLRKDTAVDIVVRFSVEVSLTH